MPRFILVCATLAMMSASSEAQLLYDFVEVSTGDVLATLELSDLPASETEVVSLTFSLAGESLFGYSAPYSGGFDAVTLPGAIDDGAGGIAGGQILDTTPQDSTLHPNNGTETFALTFSSIPNEDTINVSPHLGQPHDRHLFSRGNWNLVPEPSTGVMSLTIVLCGAGVRRPRNVSHGCANSHT